MRKLVNEIQLITAVIKSIDFIPIKIKKNLKPPKDFENHTPEGW